MELRRQAGPKHERRKTLIVAPLGVHDHWRKHLIMFGVSPKDIVCIDRKDRTKFVRALKGPQLYYILHYEGLRLKDVKSGLVLVHWFHIVADECHRVKNRKAQQTQALKGLRTAFKTGTSGTPADDKPADLWSILNWLYPRKYTSYWRHVKRYCREQETVARGTTYRKWVEANPETVPEMLAEMNPWYVRRLKEAVLSDLPEKYYTDITVDLDPRQRRAYDAMRKEMIAWVGEHEDQPLSAPAVVAQLIRLQQFALGSAELSYRWVHAKRTCGVCRGLRQGEHDKERRLVVSLTDPSAKIDALEELVEDNPDKQFVVFSQFKSAINLAARRLESKGVTVGRYTGDITDQRDRDRTVEAFQRGNLRVFAGTIAAGGEGIELTAASTEVFLDRHWSPTKNRQAEDRCHRIGQRNAVQVIDIIARNTVDLGRRTAIAKKWANLQLILGDIVRIEDYRP